MGVVSWIKMKRLQNTIFSAARSGNLSDLRKCWTLDFDVNHQDKHGKTALLHACENNRPAIVKQLLRMGADPNAADTEGWSPLLTAANLGYLRILKLLIQNKADINARTTSIGRFPLRQAAGFGHMQCIQYLLQNGADVNLVNCKNGTALYTAAEHNQLEAVDYLLKAGADPNIGPHDGSTPLYLATQHGNLSMVRILLAARANIERKHVSGATPFTVACALNRLKVVRALCEAGCDINHISRYGETGLHWAVRRGYRDLVEYLLYRGARLIENKKVKHPLYYAEKEKRTYIAGVLKMYMLSSSNTSIAKSDSNKSDTCIASEPNTPSAGDSLTIITHLKDELNDLTNEMDNLKRSMVSDIAGAVRQGLQDAIKRLHNKSDVRTARLVDSTGQMKDLWQRISNVSVRKNIVNDPAVLQKKLEDEELLKSCIEISASKLTNDLRRLFRFLAIPHDRIMELHDAFVRPDNTDGAAWTVLVEWLEDAEGSGDQKGQILKEASIKVDLEFQDI